MRIRNFHLVVVGVLIASSGLIHGWWTHRWAAAAPASAGKSLLEMEEPVAGFQPAAFFELNPADMPEGCSTASRRFEVSRGGRNTVVSVTCGHPGIVAVHTPDVCYMGTGYKLKGTVRQETLPLAGDAKASYYVADFQKNTATGTETIRVRWAWSADGKWQAPDYPRWYFARESMLYKVYVVHALNDDEHLTKEDPYRKFVAALLPALSRHFAR